MNSQKIVLDNIGFHVTFYRHHIAGDYHGLALFNGEKFEAEHRHPDDVAGEH